MAVMKMGSGRTVRLTLTESQVKAIKAIALYVQSEAGLGMFREYDETMDDLVKQSWDAETVANNGLHHLGING